MNKQRIIIFAIATILSCSLLTGGCAKKVRMVQEPLPDIVWPNAPEEPRIRFVCSIKRPEDLRIRAGAFKRFINYMAGKSKVSIAAPYGVETDSLGRIYVVDTFFRTVHLFDWRNNSYHSFPAKETRLVSPIDIAIDNITGCIYVSDSKEKVVKIFKNMGKEFVGELGRGVLDRPTGITINPKTSELLVVDTVSGNIFRYELGNHAFKGIFGSQGSNKSEFHHPTNIYATKDGSICVSDSLNFRVQMFSSDGRFLKGFGSAGDSSGYFSRPKGVAVDSDGNIYVVDALFDNIQMFDKNGMLLMAFGGHGNGYGEFWLPTGIFIDKEDTIYVSDSYNKRVQVFQYLKGEVSAK